MPADFPSNMGSAEALFGLLLRKLSMDQDRADEDARSAATNKVLSEVASEAIARNKVDCPQQPSEEPQSGLPDKLAPKKDCSVKIER